MFAFFRQTLDNFTTTGAIAPSSAALARALCAEVARPASAPREILEAGPGTGAVTASLVRALGPDDKLVLCEINPAFVAHLRARFSESGDLHAWEKQVEIVEAPVQDLQGDARFAHIVCGLPFNNFPPALVAEIFDAFRRMLHPEGTLSFFEYAALRTLKKPFVNKSERQRLNDIETIVGGLVRAQGIRRRLIIGNLPPAYANTVTLHPPQ